MLCYFILFFTLLTRKPPPPRPLQDMAHIHYLHGDSFGNAERPEIVEMAASADDAYSVTASFRIANKPVNAFWSLFQVPSVAVTARGFLPSTSLVQL